MLHAAYPSPAGLTRQGTRQRFLLLLLLIPVCLNGAATASRAAEKPDWPEVEQVVRRYFDAAWDENQIHLMTQGHVKTVLAQLEHFGWRIDARALLKDIPADHEYLVQELATPAGQKFLSHLQDEKILYDRLDRIIKLPGGRRLVHDMIRLPDGYRYAKQQRPRGVPGMDEFLPKTSNGKDQKIADYDKPTGRIYTLELFLERLRKMHQQP